MVPTTHRSTSHSQSGKAEHGKKDALLVPGSATNMGQPEEPLGFGHSAAVEFGTLQPNTLHGLLEPSISLTLLQNETNLQAAAILRRQRQLSFDLTSGLTNLPYSGTLFPMGYLPSPRMTAIPGLQVLPNSRLELLAAGQASLESSNPSASVARSVPFNKMNHPRDLKQAAVQPGHLEKLAFPDKIYHMLHEQSHRKEVVSFVAAGTSFLIHDPRIFETEIMPLYFTSTRLASFQRQLNLYGFQRVERGPFRGAYRHPSFVQGQKDLLVNIKRQVTRRKKAAEAKKEEKEEEQSDQGGS